MNRTLVPLGLTLGACLVACISYVGAIATDALVVLLLPVVVVAGLAGARLRGRLLAGAGVVLAVGLVGAEAVNVASGDFQGPAARSTFVASICTGLAVVLSGSPMPAAFLAPLSGIVVGALALGAGGQVQLVAVLTAGLALIALAAIERERRAMVTSARTGLPIAAALLLILAAGIFAALFQGRHDGRAAYSPFRSSLTVAFKAPGLVTLPEPASTPAATAVVPTPATPTRTRTAIAPGQVKTVAPSVRPRTHATGRPIASSRPTRPAIASPTAVTPPAAASGQHSSHTKRWFLLLLIPIVLLLALLGRLLASWWTWRRLYRRIAKADPGPAGAWLWSVAHLDRVGLAPPAYCSPDVLAAGDLTGLVAEVRTEVQQLAAVVAPALYAYGEPTPEVAVASWSLARSVSRHAWSIAGLSRRSWARWRLAPRRAVPITPPARELIGSVGARG